MIRSRQPRRHDRLDPTVAGAALLFAALALLPSGCVHYGEFVTRRLVKERHPLGPKQTVLTVSGQVPPPAHEVHQARLRHGAPRVARTPDPLPTPTIIVPSWWPGFMAWAFSSPDPSTACGEDGACQGDAQPGAGCEPWVGETPDPPSGAGWTAPQPFAEPDP